MAKKRNFARRYHAANPNAAFVPLSEETMPLLKDFLAEWYELEGEMTKSLLEERAAIETALENREALNLSGGLLMSEGRVDGFTYGTLVAKDIFAVHIEKARRDVTGAYPALSSAFAKSLPEDVVFLNREEDIGIPGLRKAKLAWMPCGMIQKGVVEIVPAN